MPNVVHLVLGVYPKTIVIFIMRIANTSINHFIGISLQTSFFIECVNWIDLDGSIVRYEYFGNNYYFKKKLVLN